MDDTCKRMVAQRTVEALKTKVDQRLRRVDLDIVKITKALEDDERHCVTIPVDPNFDTAVQVTCAYKQV